MAPAGFSGVFDWDFLLSAFDGTNITPMDMDCVVERKGKVLIIESKSSQDVRISTGQRITFESFLRIGQGAITVFILYGKSDDYSGWEEWYYKGKGNGEEFKKRIYHNESMGFKERVASWFQWADSNGTYKNKT